MSDEFLNEYLKNNPWKNKDKTTPDTVMGTKSTIESLQKAVASMEAANVQSKVLYLNYVDNPYIPAEYDYKHHSYSDYFKEDIFADILKHVPPPYPDLKEPSAVNGGSDASAFVQYYWGTPNLSVNNISITKLLVGYAEHVCKQLTEEIVKDYKKQQRDACIPRYKKNARKFRTV